MTEQDRRKDLMAVLSLADRSVLISLWQSLGLDPEFQMVRPPEAGIIGLRGRIGGGGDSFNFGEATIIRATVKLANGAIGHSYALGRDHVKAKISAILDALAQDETMAARIEQEVIEPLRVLVNARDAKRAAETAATKVDFFTMVRGED